MTLLLKRFRAALALVTLLATTAALGALEVRDGKMKLVLHESLGRFSLYYLADLQKGTYVPLFVDTDPRTSCLTLVVDSRVTRLGESSEYQQETRRTARGAEFAWKSRLLEVAESFELVTSNASQLADGVRITVSIKNLGEQALEIGVRVLLDTYLGEEGSYHFLLDGQKQLTRETDLTGALRPSSWVSAKPGEGSSSGLLCITSGSGVDIPDRIVFANWQRLNDSSWTFPSSANRGFSNLPYSVNDSAVASYHNPRLVPAGTTMTLASILAASSAGSFGASGAARNEQPRSTNELLSAIASTANIADPTLAAKTDLGVLDDLLRSIESRLGSAGAATDKDLEALANALRELSARVRKYTGVQAQPASP